MPGSKTLVFCSLLCMTQLSMVACASTEQKASKSAPIYFSDCGVVNLQATDGRNMTREELIAAEDNTLLEALDDNSECNQKALSSGQQAVAAAGGTSGQDGGTGQNGQQGAGPNGQTSQENSIQQQAQQVITSNTGVGGGKTGVEGKEITVCQISKENLAASTTPEDKEFWRGEVDKNCN